MQFSANLALRKGRFLVSLGSVNPDTLKSLLEEISKITPLKSMLHRATSVKCKVNVDSYNSRSIFNGREYSLVRI